MKQAITELKTLCNVEIALSEQDVQRSMCRKNFKHFLRFCKSEDTQRSLGILPFPIEYPYIQRVADELQYNRQNVILKSRQMIITWLMAAKTVWKCNFNTSQLYPIISRVEDVAKEIKDRAWTIWEHLPEWLKADATATVFEIKWPKLRSRIKSMPCTEDVARSFSASNVMVDEGAFLKWGNLMFASIKPIIDNYGGLDICSTPNGKDGLFHPLWHSKNKNYNKIIVHWSEHPLRGKAWADEMREDIGDPRWLREYELSFATPAGKVVHADFDARQIIAEQWKAPTPIIRGWDRGYHSPATVWSFLNGIDQWIVDSEYMGEDVDRDKYIKSIVEMSKARYPDADFIDWVPGDFGQAESDGQSWVKVMKKYGIRPKIGKAGKDEVVRRVDAVRKRRKLRQDGKFGMLINPRCKILIEGFGGGYHYPEIINRPEDEKPVKDGYFDHLQNAVEVIADNHWSDFGEKKTLQTLRFGKPRRVA